MISNHLNATDILFILVTLLISMTVHEFMHGYVGYKLGDPTASEEGRLTLNPLAHIDPIMTVVLPLVTLIIFGVPFLAAKPVPFNPGRVKYGDYGAALLAFAGPLSNLVLAILGVLILKNVASSSYVVNFLNWFVSLNVIMFVFNLIPIPPLDGSRVLYAFAPEPLQDFMRSIERFGFFIIIALVLVGGANGLLVRLYQDVLTLITNI
ncbi:MAG: site-2 protease family protein [Candidatus Saccharimonadales bacterium]